MNAIRSFHTHNDHPEIAVNKTALVGTIQATREQLTRAFGNPIATHGSKVTTEWHLMFADRSVATIYDWDLFTQPPDDEVIVWRIGGGDPSAVQKVHNAFRDALGMARSLRSA